MTLARNLVGQDAGEGQCRPVTGQSQRQRTEGLTHATGIDQHRHRDAEGLGQISTGWGTIEQAHGALDQDQIGLASGRIKLALAFRSADHPEVERLDI